MSTAFTDREHGLLIGGQWQPSASGDTLTSVNPATGRPLAAFARGGAADVDLAVAAARAALGGLAAGVWTRDITRAHQIAAAIKAGTVWVNCYNLTDPASPFGGYKQSGWGREMGRTVLEQYTETKSVWVNVT